MDMKIYHLQLTYINCVLLYVELENEYFTDGLKDYWICPDGSPNVFPLIPPRSSNSLHSASPASLSRRMI